MKFQVAAAMLLSASACAPMPPLPDSSGFTAAADPARVTVALSRGPVVDHVRREVVAPGDWRSLNDAQSEN